jgi:hypothetical protein
MRTLPLLMLLAACGGAGDDDSRGDDTGTPVASGDDDDDGTTSSTETDSGSQLPAGLDGRDGGCLNVSGPTDRVRSVTAGLPLGDDPRTIQVWMHTERTSGDQVAVSHGNGAPGRGFHLGTSDGRLMVSTGGLVERTDLFVADGTWHHVVVTYAEGVAWLWVDGERRTSVQLEVDTPDGEVVAGNAPIGQDLPWTGWLDEVRVYARVRPDADLMDAPEGDDLGLKVWWDFEQRLTGAGSVVPDASGQGADAEVGGTEDSPRVASCP